MSLMTRFFEWRERQRDVKAIKELAHSHLVVANLLTDRGDLAGAMQEMDQRRSLLSLAEEKKCKRKPPDPSEQFDTHNGCYPAPLTNKDH